MVMNPKRMNPKSMNEMSSNAMQKLQSLLEQMNVCARELESITQDEYEAIRSLDAEKILQMGDRRILAHQCLEQLEQQCRNLLTRENIPGQMTLSAVIDMYTGIDAMEFQALRRNLYERIVKVDQQSQENRMRLHAAYNVSTTILQSLGLSAAEQTYQRRTTG